MKTFGLALSGGGLRGLAHIGVLKALEEMGLKPSAVSGVSAGAIIGAFYCAGYSPAGILDIYRKEGKLAFRKPHWPTQGLFSLQKLEEALGKHIGHAAFEELQIPLYVIATDILKAQQVVFSSGNVIKPIMGSSAIPALFDPVEHEGHLLVDGGILNNFPVEPLQGKCDTIMGIYVNPIGRNIQEPGMRDMIDRSIHLMMESRENEKAKQIDLFIQPPALANYRMFDSDKMQEIHDTGYNYVKEIKDQVLSVVAG